MTSLREAIYNLLDESARVKAGYYTDAIVKLIEERLDKMIKDESQGSLYNAASDSVLTLKQVKEELLK